MACLVRLGALLAVTPFVAGPGAEPAEFVAVGVGLALGALGPGPQVGTQLVAVAGGLGAEAGQHLVRIGANPGGLGTGGLGSSLRTGGVLLGKLGGLLGLGGPC